MPRRGKRVPDLVVFGEPGSPGRLLLNNGKGRFHNGPILPAPAANAGPAIGGCAVAADLNGDGNLDVIAGFTHPEVNAPDVLQILINNG